MASTYSPSLRLELMGNGDQAGTWGQTTNTNLGTLLEQAITGVQTITLADADHTLTNLNGAADEARNAVLIINGTTSAIRNIIAPTAQQKTYIIYNSTTGGFGVTIKTSGGAGITVPFGATQVVYTDGTNFYLAASPTNLIAGSGISVSTVGINSTITNTGLITAVAGSGIATSITGTQLSVTNTGVLSLAGTANQVTVSGSTGNITLSLPSTIAVNISGNAATATNSNTTSQTNFTNLTIGGSQVLDAANFNSYSPTLTGTGASGTWSINITGNSNTTSQTNFNNLTISGSQVLDAANFNSYAPTLSGTGATGTWGISITGNAATATNATNATNASYATSAGNSATTSQTNFSNLTINNSQVLDAANYNSYSPTLGGTGATGTWPINISGNAATATNATNANYATNAGNANGLGGEPYHDATNSPLGFVLQSNGSGQGIWMVPNPELGVSQSYTGNILGSSRTNNTVYYNSTSKPIFVFIGEHDGGGVTCNAYVNGALAGTCGGGYQNTICIIVPIGGSYEITSGQLTFWAELR